jgi:hypothetical protein
VDPDIFLGGLKISFSGLFYGTLLVGELSEK